MGYKDASAYTGAETRDSSKLSGTVPSASSTAPFVPQQFVQDKLIYDPSYIYKFKEPTIPELIATVNRLAAAVTDLQSVVINLVGECGETRRVLENDVWRYTRYCCDRFEIDYSDVGHLWDGSGVLQEGVSPYIKGMNIE